MIEINAAARLMETAGKKPLTLAEWKARVSEKCPGAKFQRDHAGIMHGEYKDRTVGSYTKPDDWYVTTQPEA